MCQQLALAMNARIYYNSEVNKSTTFILVVKKYDIVHVLDTLSSTQTNSINSKSKANNLYASNNLRNETVACVTTLDSNIDNKKYTEFIHKLALIWMQLNLSN